ncbi:CRISPR-associated protein [Cylindrospermum stagnale PCC 7417]|uniref:CRISPR-associated protein n=2 Tax=Cylindrospermum stagnale TaxID=142864 RepID=K9X7T5_9NOST|nr:CRISPR-associated protein [Cylindrospermum stagnale PCC 7417]
MTIKHIHHVPQDKKAVAPYNFVELPDQIVKAELEENCKLRDNDRYYQDRHTGRIQCNLNTSSPLYIRCGLTPEQFNFVQEQLRQEREVSDYPDFFYNPVTNKPEIAGSSLRGMFRTLIEIISFSKIDKVSDAQKFFFRAVAADKDDPLKDEYIKYLGNQGKNVKAGYFQQKGDKWFVRPAKSIDNYPFVWVKEKSVINARISGYIPIENISDYKPQYFINISFEDIQTKNGRKFAQKISSNSQDYDYNGVLLTSGNMLEGATRLPDEVNRKNHCLIREPNPDAELIPIDDDAIQDYKKSLTPFQKQEPPFDPEMGVLKQGRAIFYCQHQQGQSIKLFGQSPNFRIPYYPKGHIKTASAVDFIPANLRESSIIDIADAIFGFVRSEKQTQGIQQSRAGRIFISNAECQTDNNDIWLENYPITPKILASPKPTTFQHYLVQSENTNAVKINLNHYASEPTKDTVIRGHKLYWHKGSEPEIKHLKPDEASATQLTQIKPIKPGVNFEFTIHFENLSDVELGALMWVLDIAQDNKYRLSLGMGKPLGMGAIKITHELYLNQRTNRYAQLFSGNNWNLAETVQQASKYKDEFEKYILTQPQLTKIGQFNKIPRIKMLLALLTWEEDPSQDYLEQTRYMEIEREQKPRLGYDHNEYKARRVLPTPLQVIQEILPILEFTEGQIIEGTVTNIEKQSVQDGRRTKLKTTITYEIKGSDCPSKEEVNKQEVTLFIGDIVKVKIEKFQGTSVRRVKRVE